jgi:phospholipid/cholesterol/gamma-HCH transport system permease protein
VRTEGVAAPSQYWTTRLATSATATPLRALRVLGEAALFVGQTFWLLPVTVRNYRRETYRQINSLAWGRGSIIVDGGVISVLLLLGVALGASLAIEALAILDQIGFGALSGLISGVACVREIAPLVAGIALCAQTGCRMTAEIGAMRIGDEIDAVESMGLRPIPFVVGTRLIGALVCVLPGYMLTLIAIFFVMDTMVVTFNDEHGGTFNHYFTQFLTPTDLLYSVLKVAVFCIVVTLIHCYYGYFASGGPVGVGQASGRAVRASMVMLMVMDLSMTVVLWGLKPVFEFTG